MTRKILELKTSNADLRDVASIDAIIAAAYDVISGPGDKKRDWNRERALFYPGALIIPTATVPGKADADLEKAEEQLTAIKTPQGEL